MRGSVICVCLMVVYYGILYAGIKEIIKGITIAKKNLAILCFVSLAVIAFSGLYVHNEKVIYYWDYGAYWYRTVQTDFLHMSAGELIANLKDSIDTADYNILPSLIVAIPLKICGDGYAAFVILNMILFYVPNCILAFAVAEKALYRVGCKWHDQHTYIVCCICFFFSTYIVPILLGYLDICCCPLLTCIYGLVISKAEFQKLDPKRDFLIASSIVMVLLMRRYFAYAIVGGAFFIIPYWMIEKKVTYKKSVVKLLDMACSIVPSFGFLGVFFPGLMKRYFFNNYSYTYSAYSSMGIGDEWITLIKYFGIFIILLVVAATVVGRNFEFRKLSLCLVASVMSSATMFFRTQDMGTHHYYIILFPMLLLVILGMVGIEERVGKQWGGKAIEIAFVSVMVINFLTQFGIEMFSESSLFVSRIIRPQVRDDIKEIQELDYKIEDLINNDGYKGVFCTASSNILNADILNKAFGANSKVHFFVETNDVDLRDGFNTAFFDSDIVIATEVAQIHLTQGQEIIQKLNSYFNEGSIVSRKYVKNDVFTLENGIKVNVWVRQKRLSQEDIRYIQTDLASIYPDMPDLVYDRIENYLDRNVIMGDEYTDFYSVTFSNQAYSSNAEDKNGARIVHPDGISYGPYITLLPGRYEISIIGDNNIEECDIYCSYESGIKFENNLYEELTEDMGFLEKRYLIDVTEEVRDFEVVVRNKTSNDVSIFHIEITFINSDTDVEGKDAA